MHMPPSFTATYTPVQLVSSATLCAYMMNLALVWLLYARMLLKQHWTYCGNLAGLFIMQESIYRDHQNRMHASAQVIVGHS